MDSKNKRKLFWQVPFLIVLIVGTVLIVRQQRNMPYQHNTGFIFGTVYNVTYQSDKNLQSEIEQQMRLVDAALSPFNPNSIISHINRNEAVTTNKMFDDVFSLAERVSADTGGAFDITVAPLVNLWGFGFKKGQDPSRQSIDSIRALVGYQKVRLVNHRVIKADKRIMLDCSAIAKGYGSDVVANYLRSKGIKNFMIEIGGEIVTSGISESRLPWKIGVTKPVDDSLQTNQELQTVLNVTDKAMATSGNYRNFYYKGGKKYAHTIDPKSGYPVQHNILSATVLADNCATADAYATAFMVTGLHGAQQILKRHPELMVYFIYSDRNGRNQVWYSPSMKKTILPQSRSARMQELALIAVLQHLSLFIGMSREELVHIATQAKFDFKTLASGEVLAREGDRCGQLIVLTNGSLNCRTDAIDHGYWVEEPVHAPAIIQLDATFGVAQRFTHTFTAISSANIILLDKNQTLKLTNDSLIFRLNLLNNLSTTLQKLQQMQWSEAPRSLRSRMARFFVVHSLRPAGQKTFHIKMNRLAQELNDSRLNISKALHQLSDDGLLTFSRGAIRIPALEKLIGER
jgi:thiamine biosynthesis lipoprotein